MDHFTVDIVTYMPVPIANLDLIFLKDFTLLLEYFKGLHKEKGLKAPTRRSSSGIFKTCLSFTMYVKEFVQWCTKIMHLLKLL